MAQTVAAPAKRSFADLRRAAVSGWLGTALEFMDFQLYSLAAALVFNKIFFPDASPAVALIASLGTYAVGYVARPLGAWYFGRMGDRIGRTKVLVITIALMGGATTLIGFLPTYAVIGIWAPIMLVILRLAQGFGAGAEIAGASVMLAEYAPTSRRGLVSSLVALGTNSGTLLASGIWAALVAFMPEDMLFDWGWRIPFIASFLVMFFALWIRLKLKESPVFEGRADVVDGVALSKAELKAEPAHRNVLGEALHSKKGRSFLIAMGLRFGESGNSGIIQTYLIGYIATAILVDRAVGTTAIMIGSVIGFATVPLFGWLGDRFGRRPIYIAVTIFQALFAVPAMLMINTGDTFLISLALIIGLSVSVLGMFSVQSSFLPELFGARNRYTQLALAKEFGGIIAAGIGPVVAAWLVALTESWWPIAAMMIGYSVVALVAAIVSPETRGRDLTDLRDAA
ncbi:MHS family metabolite:H+ symporter-like MFS transporter [Mycetocola sp. BIGb0189]|uniref:MFS transporter n=1 Tax=Mycetocola sp. BIGb0189 TaxID=2940604 RepID=UPI002169A1C6|nr:MFS transporter [Mycetocola sp. BIGb0189]MCS4275324.1 MHS family metabolite:H+ symporter-like MFS transporter [Mycetocola sp. BIGb0189]